MSIDRRAMLVAGLALPVLAAASGAHAAGLDPLLRQAIDDPRRKPADRARDGARHPAETLSFWGLKPGMTVIDVNPGSGWWTDIIAPYLAATHGRYIAAGADLDNPKLSDAARRGRATFEAKYADKAIYGDVSVVGFSRVSGPLAPPATVDLVIVSRETHNWTDGFIQKAFGDFHAALKPGGLMGIEEHRAADGADPKAGTGYVTEAWVIEQAKAAGFRLDGRSDVNANPKDTKDHPFGVWTLPPTRQSAPSGQPADPTFDHAKYDAIGESDRMTLRFVRV